MNRSLLTLVLACFISSCASVYYPSHVNSSFIEKKGETNVGGAVSLSSLNIQASSALTDHLRIAGGLNYWGWNVTLGSSTIEESGLQTQFLTGYYSQLGRSVFFEGYGGIGVSVANDDFYSHVIIQPSIGFGQNKPKFIVSVRGNYLTNTLFSDPNSGAELGPDETNEVSGMFYDFAFTHRFHNKNKTWFFQYGMSRDSEQYGDTDFIPFMNFGLNFKLFSKNYIPPETLK